MARSDGTQGLQCHGCGAIFPIAPGADLHCAHDCRTDYESAVDEAVKALTSEGFSRDTAAPNLFIKDGVAVSLEQVIREGFKRTLEAHNAAVAIHATR